MKKFPHGLGRIYGQEVPEDEVADLRLTRRIPEGTKITSIKRYPVGSDLTQIADMLNAQAYKSARVFVRSNGVYLVVYAATSRARRENEALQASEAALQEKLRLSRQRLTPYLSKAIVGSRPAKSGRKRIRS